MNHAKVEKSDRLQRILAYLRSEKGGVSSWMISMNCRVVAPGTCVSELRRNGFQITMRWVRLVGQARKVPWYQLVEPRVGAA